MNTNAEPISNSLVFASMDVATFRAACDLPVSQSPGLVDEDERDLHINLVDEECNELITALEQGNLVGIADGGIDLIYVTIGLLLHHGIPIPAVWKAVHDANMAKVDPVTGKVRRRSDGKVLKPDGWTPPDDIIAAIIKKAQANFEARIVALERVAND